MLDDIRNLNDLQVKIEEKLTKIQQSGNKYPKDIFVSNNILKLGKTLDYHTIQQLVSWLKSD